MTNPFVTTFEYSHKIIWNIAKCYISASRHITNYISDALKIYYIAEILMLAYITFKYFTVITMTIHRKHDWHIHFHIDITGELFPPLYLIPL